MSEFAALLVEWGGANQREWGDDIGFPEKAAFADWMIGGSVSLPPAEVDRIERIGKAIYRAGRVERLVIDAHFRKHSSYHRIAQALSRMLGRHVRHEEVSRLLANAIMKAEREYAAMEGCTAVI